jgi:thioredoxin-related protein
MDKHVADGMTRPSSRLVVAIVSAVCAGVLIAGILLSSRTVKAVGLRIYPASSQFAPSGTVTFYVTNGEPGLVHLARLEIQVASSNAWETISTETAGILNRGAPSYQWAGGLLAGSQRPLSVHPPAEGRWRVRLTYLRQARGLYPYLSRARVLLLRGVSWANLFQWRRGNVFSLADHCEVVSQEFSRGQSNLTANATVNSKQPSLYDESADGSKQIAEALSTATAEHKHVLLMFGANNCGWCHRLHSFFQTDTNVASELSSSFVVVMVDMKPDGPDKIENWHNGYLLKKYSPVYQGVPFVVVLDADGKQLTTQDDGVTGRLVEGKNYSHDKVMAFLKKWAPK